MTVIALCTITKTRFRHLRPPPPRVTLTNFAFYSKACMSNMRCNMKIVHKIRNEGFLKCFFFTFILIYKRHYSYSEQTLVQVTQINH